MRHPSWASTLLVRHLLTGHLDGGPLSHFLGMAVIVSALSTLPPVYIGILNAGGSRFGGGGVKGDSQS